MSPNFSTFFYQQLIEKVAAYWNMCLKERPHINYKIPKGFMSNIHLWTEQNLPLYHKLTYVAHKCIYFIELTEYTKKLSADLSLDSRRMHTFITIKYAFLVISNTYTSRIMKWLFTISYQFWFNFINIRWKTSVLYYWLISQ